MPEYNFVPDYQKPRMTEIIAYRIGCGDEEYDTSWIEEKGRVILKIACQEGVFLLVITNEF